MNAAGLNANSYCLVYRETESIKHQVVVDIRLIIVLFHKNFLYYFSSSCNLLKYFVLCLNEELQQSAYHLCILFFFFLRILCDTCWSQTNWLKLIWLTFNSRGFAVLMCISCSSANTSSFEVNVSKPASMSYARQ